MKIYIEKDYDAMSERAADYIAEKIRADFPENRNKSNFVLGCATGSTPLGLYRELVNWNHCGELDFSNVSTFNLDEYTGLGPENPRSYFFYMNQNLFSQVNIDADKVYFPNPDGCAGYEALIQEKGGIDLQILGIGRNGHIGFNEPGADFSSRTRVVELSPETIKDNARFFEREEDVPRRAVTMGIATIMETAEIVLLASGENKAQAVCRALRGEITKEIPASILQKHPRLTVVLDKDAGSLITKNKTT